MRSSFDQNAVPAQAGEQEHNNGDPRTGAHDREVPVSHKTAASAARALAVIGSLIGVAALLGWAFDIRALAALGSSSAALLPNSALAAVAAGLALYLFAGRQRDRAAATLAAVPLAVGLLTLFEYAAKVDLGIDGLLLFGREWGRMAANAPGRIGLPAAAGFAILGIAIVAAAVFPRVRRFAPLSGLIVLIIALVSLLGYLFGSDDLFTVSSLTTTEFGTTLVLLAFGLALVLSLPDHEPMRSLLDERAAGRLARRTLGWAVAVPILLGAAHIWLGNFGFVDNELGTALLVLLMIAVICGVLWRAVAATAEYERSAGLRENLFAGIVGSITDDLLVFDSQWRLRFASRSTLNELGVTLDRLQGSRLWDVFPDLVGGYVHQQLERAMNERVSISFENYDRSKDRWFFNRAYPTPDGGLAVYTREITDQKLAEQRIRESERRQRLALDAGRLGVWEWQLDTGRAWIDARTARLLGVDLETFDGTVGAVEQRIVPEDLPEIRERSEAARRSRAGYTVEFRVRDVDGRVRWLSSETVPTLDEAGEVVGFTGVTADITERRSAEAALRESEERFRRLADDAPVFIWIGDENANNLYANRRMLDYFGLKDDTELAGRSWEAMYHPDDLDRSVSQYLEAASERRPFTMENRARSAAGEYRWMMWRGTPRYEDGRFVGYMGVGVDIHERRLAEDSRRETEERFTLATEAAKAIVYDADMTGARPTIVHGLEHVTGYRAKDLPDLSSKWWHSIIHPDDLPDHLAAYERYMRTGGRYRRSTASGGPTAAGSGSKTPPAPSSTHRADRCS
ncbi:MAG: PAS domain S-box protein [Pyrinomonadaceae bacterium]